MTKSFITVALLMAVTGGTLTGSFTSQASADQYQSQCSKDHLGERVMAHTETYRKSKKVSGIGAGMEARLVARPACGPGGVALNQVDRFIDLHLSAMVYKWDAGDRKYKMCHVVPGSWTGYYKKKTWSGDVDNMPNKCGWKTQPIRVRTTTKGEFDDGTIITTNMILVEKKL